jgi:WD40 repeat protein
VWSHRECIERRDIGFGSCGENADRLRSVSCTQQIRITDLSTGTSHLLRGHTKPVRVLQVSSDRSRLASLDGDSSIWLWDPRTGMGRRLGGDDTRFRDTLAFSAGGTRLASISTEGTIWLWDTSLGVVRRILPGVERVGSRSTPARQAAAGSRGPRQLDDIAAVQLGDAQRATAAFGLARALDPHRPGSPRARARRRRR